MPLEDELGDILQKARDGKAWSQDDLVRATNLPKDDIQRIESYQLTPEDSDGINACEGVGPGWPYPD